MAWQQDMAALGAWAEDEPMADHVTLAAGGHARWFFRPDSAAALSAALVRLPVSVAIMPLGRGSNLLVTDGGFDGLIIDLSGLDALNVQGERLHCGAGVRMSAVAARCAELGLAGVEFMATVPGNIGGAVAMNAGAFGQQVSDCLTAVDLLGRDGRQQSVAAEALAMAYRSSQLDGALVVAASFALRQADGDAIRQRIRGMRSQRGKSQPLAQPNCGSVFKNPPKDHAARLIEAAGLKGHRIGAAEISSHHANFIVNVGGATASDVLALIAQVQSEVQQQFGVALEPELKVVGG
ncbi:MAG: UDP-N-acetylmuramate dehydrogenase [Mariprofundales bacterium]